MTAAADRATDDAVPAFRPISFDLAGETRLFGWFHAPRASLARRCGVVLCNPFAEAALSVHRSYRVLAETLASSGYPALRFDYDGTGDSAGSDADPDRLAAWIASIHSAIDTCKKLSGVEEVALFGLRFGGLLATLAASERSDIGGMMLWAPVVSGRKFVRELRMLQATSAAAHAASAGLASTAIPFDGLEAAGFRHSAATIADIGAIDLLKRSPPKVPLVLLDRDDVAPDDELAEQWSAAGVALQRLPLPGYAAMMRDAQYAIVPNAVIDGLLAWLQQMFPAQAIVPPPPQQMPKALTSLPPAGAETGTAVCEQPVWFGTSSELFGILSRPQKPSGSLIDTAVILLNAGGNHRIGPSRLTVPLARYLAALGCTTLRLDLAGLGDSLPILDKLPIFDVGSVADVRHAIDFLSGFGETTYRQFVMLGLCSGGFIAMHAAIQDPRVNSQIVLNLPAFEATPANSAERVAKLYIKPFRFYAQAFLNPQTWRRAVSGGIDLRRILTGATSKLYKRVRVQQRLMLAQLRLIRDRSIAADFRRLGRRGVKSLLILSANDGAVDEMETHLGKNASRMRRQSNFRYVTLEGADHTFTAESARQNLFRTLREHFENLVSPKP